MKKKTPAHSSKSNTPAAKGRRKWPIYLVMLIFGAVIISGFFLAGRQHFSSMDYGMKNSKLSRQIEALEAEKRRLLLAREVSLSPGEIMRVARKIGLSEASDAPVTVAQASSVAPARAIPTAGVPQKPMVVKTAAVSPASQPGRTTAALYSKPEKIERQARRAVPAE